MFKLKQTPTFKWPVEVNIATDGGKFVKETFDAEFKRVTQPELAELQRKIEAGELTDRALVQSIITGWDGVTEDGEPVPFSQQALGQMLDIPGAAAGIVFAFVQAQSGVVRKN